MWRMQVPLFVSLPRKTRKDRRVILNLNHYRNMNHFTLAEAKRVFEATVPVPLLPAILKPPFRAVWTLFPNRWTGTVDLENPLPIISKFTMDLLQKEGVIANDDMTIVQEVTYKYGGIDKDNPRAELELWPLS